MNIAILGTGESGMGAAFLAHSLKMNCFVSDGGKIKEEDKKWLTNNKIPFEETSHSLELIAEADLVIKSPGIPDHLPLIQNLKDRGCTIVSEIEFAVQHTQAKIIAITGSNGKTTTTQLTYDILKNAGLFVGLGGNIGVSFARQVAEKDFDYYVLELSSFQLDGCYRFAPHIAAITNITPDHLDRYEYKMENYVASKFRIAQSQTANDFLIINANDKESHTFLSNHTLKTPHFTFSLNNNKSEAYIEKGKLIFKDWDFSLKEASLKGPHNAMNMMTAGLLASALNISPKTIADTFRNFNNIEHRLQNVATINGVSYINDSKATNVDAVQWALQSFDQPIIWIVGGKDKGNDYNILMPLVEQNVKAIITLGLDNEALFNSFGYLKIPIVEVFSMKEAIDVSKFLSQKDDCVLLSPACASFDLFKNYIDRGNQFVECVNE